MKKKILVACLCVALAVLTVAGTTLAYLTSKDTVTNTFTVGNVKITMDETDVDDSTEDATRDQNNSYKLMPGQTYTKDPIIHVDANSENCYLFVTVDNQIAAIEATGDTAVAKQMEAKGWKAVAGQTNLYVYVGTTAGATTPAVVKKSDNVTVFEKIIIADSVDNDTLATYTGKSIIVNAYAVQEEGFTNKTAADIWGATFGKPASGN
jgi:predicted ribosomally synthesized peptide with SipW-like signal peptide